MRNPFLDYYKVLLAVFVVGVHTSPLADYSRSLSFLLNLGIFRLAVPTFFLINGYYAVSALSSKASTINYVKRILLIYAFWMLLYFPLYVYTHDFSIKNVMWGLIVLLYGYGHLWYLTALMGGMLLMYFLKSKYEKRVVLTLSVIFYFIGSIIELIQGHISNLPITFSNEIAQLQMWKLNFIFFAFPFIAIGYYMKKDTLKFNQKSLLYIGLVLFAIELIISYKYFTHGRNMLFSLILIAPVILCYFLNLKIPTHHKIDSNKYLEKLSNSIYYIHGLPNFFVSLFLINIGTTNKFVLVSILSLVLSILLIKVNSKLKKPFKDKII